MTISIFGHRHPLMWVDQSESWFPAKHAHVRRHQTQHILCQQRLSYLRSTSNYFLVVAWFFYFFIEKADFFSKIQTFWRKRRPYLCVFFKKVLFADQSPLKRTQLVSLLSQDLPALCHAFFVYVVNHYFCRILLDPGLAHKRATTALAVWGDI